MTVDSYTKAILTVIAACLAILVVRQTSVVPEAKAQSVTPTSNYALVPVNPDGTIIFPSTIDARGTGIHMKRWDNAPLPVSIEKCNAYIQVSN